MSDPSIIDRVVNEGTLAGSILMLTTLSIIAWVWGIYKSIDDWVLRSILVLLVYVIAYSLLQPAIMSVTALFSGLGLAVLVWYGVTYTERVLLLVGFGAIVWIFSYVVRKNIYGNLAFIAVMIVVIVIIAKYGAKTKNAFRVFIGSTLFSWVAVYGVLYFYTSGVHGFTDSIFEIRQLAGCINQLDCFVHVLVSMSLTLIRLVIITSLWWDTYKKAQRREAALRDLEEGNLPGEKKKKKKKSNKKRKGDYEEQSDEDVPRESDDDDDEPKAVSTKLERIDAETQKAIDEFKLVLKRDDPPSAPEPVPLEVLKPEERKAEEEEDEEDEERADSGTSDGESGSEYEEEEEQQQPKPLSAAVPAVEQKQ